jgi:hypothetical protein
LNISNLRAASQPPLHSIRLGAPYARELLLQTAKSALLPVGTKPSIHSRDYIYRYNARHGYLGVQKMHRRLRRLCQAQNEILFVVSHKKAKENRLDVLL